MWATKGLNINLRYPLSGSCRITFVEAKSLLSGCQTWKFCTFLTTGRCLVFYFIDLLDGSPHAHSAKVLTAPDLPNTCLLSPHTWTLPRAHRCPRPRMSIFQRQQKPQWATRKLGRRRKRQRGERSTMHVCIAVAVI